MSSLPDLSEEFMDKQARTMEGSVMTDVKDVVIYPFTDRWWITFDCGEPFEEYVARICLGESREVALQKLNRIHDEFGSFDAVDILFVEIDLSADHEVLSESLQARIELEAPVLIDGFEGHMSMALRSGEYYMQEDHDIDHVQDEVETERILYESIQQGQEEEPELFIRDVVPAGESSIFLDIGGLEGDKSLPVQVDLPEYSDVQDSPVSEFINTVGGGRVEDLKGSSVFLYDSDRSEEVVGLDTHFEKYGVSYCRLGLDSGGFISRFSNNRFVDWMVERR